MKHWYRLCLCPRDVHRNSTTMPLPHEQDKKIKMPRREQREEYAGHWSRCGTTCQHHVANVQHVPLHQIYPTRLPCSLNAVVAAATLFTDKLHSLEGTNQTSGKTLALCTKGMHRSTPGSFKNGSTVSHPNQSAIQKKKPTGHKSPNKNIHVVKKKCTISCRVGRASQKTPSPATSALPREGSSHCQVSGK